MFSEQVRVRDLRRSGTIRNETLSSLGMSSGYHNSLGTRYEFMIWKKIGYRTRDQYPHRAQHLKQEGRNLNWPVNDVNRTKTSLVMGDQCTGDFFKQLESVVLHDTSCHGIGRLLATLQP